LCSVLFARAPVLGLCFFVSKTVNPTTNTDSLCARLFSFVVLAHVRHLQTIDQLRIEKRQLERALIETAIGKLKHQVNHNPFDPQMRLIAEGQAARKPVRLAPTLLDQLPLRVCVCTLCIFVCECSCVLVSPLYYKPSVNPATNTNWVNPRNGSWSAR